MRKDFYIFRHGQSTYNVVGRIQGQTNDSVLTNLGKEQAKEVGKKLKSKDIEVIISSPLFRARQTAELVNLTLNKKIIEDEKFTEVDVGVVEGMDYTEAKEKYSEEFKKMHSQGSDYDDACYPGGETRKQVRERIFRGLDYWASNDNYQCMAVASHGIMLSQILIALGDKQIDIPNASILHIKKENDVWEIVEWL